MKLEDLRRQIDKIDGDLLRLLNARAEIAMTIGANKRQAGLPVRDVARETQVLTRLCDLNRGPLTRNHVTAVFSAIVSVCRSLEQAEENR